MTVGNKGARVAPPILVFLALTLGFTVADLSDVRWLGGLVMLVIGGVAVFLTNRRAGVARTVIGFFVVVVGFISSHALGSLLGAYGALFVVSIACAAVIYFIIPNSGSNTD